MTFLPILAPSLFLPIALLLVAGTAWLLSRARTAARWRYAAMVLLVVLAAARPGLGGAPAPVANTELNVFFVVDTTPSSAAEDYNGSSPRLDGMKADIMALAEEFAGARFSLITFDSSAATVLPLTTDATALRTLTEVIDPRPTFNSKGSSISVADSVLAGRLAAAQQAHPERPRLVYYLGDGEQTAATTPAPFKDSPGLVDGGAVLGYGTAAGGKMRDRSFGSDKPGPWIVDKEASYAPAVSIIDEQALRNVAGQFKVPYVHREAPGGLGPALADSAPKASVQPSGQDARAGAGRWELYWVLALAAFGLALWELGSLTLLWREMQAPMKTGAGTSGGRMPGRGGLGDRWRRGHNDEGSA